MTIEHSPSNQDSGERGSQLERHENRFLNKSMLESIEGVNLFVLDSHLKYLDFTMQHQLMMADVWGAEPKLNGGWLDLVTDPKTKDTFDSYFRQTLSGESMVVEERHESSQGMPRYFEYRMSPVRHDEGAIIGLSVCVIDMTRRMLSEQELSRSRGLLSALLENTFDIWLSVDTNYVIQTINTAGQAAFKKVVNLDLQPGMKILELIPEFMRESWKARYDRALAGERYVIDDSYLEDGVTYYSEVSFNPILEDGRVTGVSVMSREVTERKQAEVTLRQSEENLRTTLNSIGDAVIATDTQGHVVRMNPVAERLTGWAQEEALGRPLNEVFRIIHSQTREPADNPVDKILATGEVVGLANHTSLISRDHIEHQIADSGAPIRNEEGGIMGVVLVFRDVTEEYALQQRLQHSQKMEAIGQLAGGVAHDFNNMLGGILGATEMLDRHLSPNEESKELHQLIIDSAERASTLTQKLLSFARKQPAVSHVIDGHQVVKDTVELLKNTVDRRIIINTRLDARHSLITGDHAQLQSALINLGVNASQSMPDGGSITVETRLVELDDHFCSASQFDISPGSFLEIEVRDTGCGIQPEHLNRIFEPFFTTKDQGKGTGLGLAAVYGTVQHHQGAITVYSELGRGTSFSIQLPISKGQIREEEQPALIRGQGTVLVIDDELVMRTTARLMLEDLGYQVLVAEDGEAGLSLFKENREKLDLVLLDMVMPKMNGHDCFMAIRDICSEVNVVVSSGFAREAELDQMRQLGLSGFIRKPYRKVELSQVLYESID